MKAKGHAHRQTDGRFRIADKILGAEKRSAN
jgi:hypothetical protein